MLRISLGARPVAGLRLTNRPFLIKGPARDVTTYLGLRMNSGVEARRLEIQPLITITKLIFNLLSQLKEEKQIKM